MTLRDFMLSETSLSQKGKCCINLFIEDMTAVKSAGTESRWWVLGDGEGVGSQCLTRAEFLFGKTRSSEDGW